MSRLKARLALAVVALTLLLGACSNALPGTAAVVGDQRITVDDLQGQVDAVLAYRSGPQEAQVRAQLPTITQQVLSGDVLHRLADLAVQRTHLQVNEKAIGDQLAKLDPNVLTGDQLAFVTPQTLPQFVHDQLVIAQLGTAAWNGLAVTADLTTATDQADAEAKAKRMAAGPAESKAVVAESSGKGQQARADYPLSPAVLEGLAGSPLFSTPAGSAVAFTLNGKWQVARIDTRTTNAPRPTSPEAVSAAQAKPSSVYTLGISLLPELSGNPEIRISPRYGSWDPTQGQVVAGSAPPSALVFNPRP